MVRPRLAEMMGANASDVEPRLHFAALSGLWSDVCGTENRNGSRMKSDGLRCHMRYPQWLLVPKAIVFESMNPSLLRWVQRVSRAVVCVVSPWDFARGRHGCENGTILTLRV